MDARGRHLPHGMTATATHDTKRGEDARTRILAISEIPELWAEQVADWRRLNAPLVSSEGGKPRPSRAHEYMLYQALLGAWPLEGIGEDFAPRMADFAIKAAREGKLETSWLNPNEDYERKLRDFVGAILDTGKAGAFLDSFAAFARRTALLGALSSLSQLVLKATMPGVPDFYQGTELWDLSLVDPDNRRPVDFAARKSALATQPDWRALAANWSDGRIKLALTHRLLALRNALPAVFGGGGYEPIDVTGPHRDHVVAFQRSAGRDRVVVAVARHFAAVTDGGTRWPDGGWQAELRLGERQRQGMRDALFGGTSGETWVAAPLFAALPIAVLLNS
jgi:(1->4)-alpha-D-glucan 1-alpha-D-glucosylmutase